jgi:hypothetical protein
MSKLGMTTQQPHKRISQTENPDYELFNAYEVDDLELRQVEIELHRIMSQKFPRKKHKSTGRFSEWFICNPSKAHELVSNFLKQKLNNDLKLKYLSDEIENENLETTSDTTIICQSDLKEKLKKRLQSRKDGTYQSPYNPPPRVSNNKSQNSSFKISAESPADTKAQQNELKEKLRARLQSRKDGTYESPYESPNRVKRNKSYESSFKGLSDLPQDKSSKQNELKEKLKARLQSRKDGTYESP